MALAVTEREKTAAAGGISLSDSNLQSIFVSSGTLSRCARLQPHLRERDSRPRAKQLFPEQLLTSLCSAALSNPTL